MNKILLLKYPTRQRKNKFFNNLMNYITKSSGKNILKIVITMDSDDEEMNSDEVQKRLKSLNSIGHVKLSCFYGESLGKINAINRDIPSDEWDVLVATADDMEPVEDGWDDIIMEDMMKHFPNLHGALNYNNDPRLEKNGPNGFKKLITLPVIGRNLYDEFGYVYHPEYKSEWCDNEQTEVFESLGVLRHIDRRPITHKWAENQDDLMKRNIYIGKSHDKEVYDRRKAMEFK